MTKEVQDMVKWRKDGKHLPDIMKDFHDQKDIFKAVHAMASTHEVTQDVNWINAHMYTLDCFLWFMARHGYTLQKSRANVDFDELQDTIKKNRDRMYANSPLLAAVNPEKKED